MAKKICVILVDDSNVYRVALKRLLQSLKTEVHEFKSAQPALQAIEKGLIADLLITDMNMPGMSGLQLAARVRSDELKVPKKRLPIVLNSGVAEGSPEEDALQKKAFFLNIDYCFSKSVISDRIEEVLRRLA